MGAAGHGIAFGTDGWRALIADGFTVDRLRIVAQAFADWLRTTPQRRQPVLIGYDGRYGGERFALAAADVIAANGFRVDVVAGPSPTPAVSWWIVKKKYGAGLMVTASHNPPAYSGVKVKPWFGGSPDSDVVGPIVAALGRRPPKSGGPAPRRVAIVDPYLANLRRLMDVKAIRRLSGTVASDPMGGAQAGYLARVLAGTRLTVSAVHDRIDPLFCGLHAPEPVEANLGALLAEVRRSRALLGIATDGDGDRVALVDEKGRFVTPHLVFALLLMHLVRQKGLRGRIVKTVSGSFLLDRIARAEGLEVEETPVGFKYICKGLMTGQVLIGGEESGGVGVRGYIPERDGLYIGLLALEMLAYARRPCSALIADLFREFGASAYARIDAHHPTAQASLKRLIASPPAKLGSERVARVNTRDGLKLIFGDDSWLLFRASGTEPLLRIYAEAEKPAAVRKLLAAGAKLAGVRR